MSFFWSYDSSIHKRTAYYHISHHMHMACPWSLVAFEPFLGRIPGRSNKSLRSLQDSSGYDVDVSRRWFHILPASRIVSLLVSWVQSKCPFGSASEKREEKRMIWYIRLVPGAIDSNNCFDRLQFIKGQVFNSFWFFVRIQNCCASRREFGQLIRWVMVKGHFDFTSLSAENMTTDESFGASTWSGRAELFELFSISWWTLSLVS